MRMIDSDRQHAVRTLQLYLTADEARSMVDQLEKLLAAPEAPEHFHLASADVSRDLSCSIFTPEKIQSGNYTKLEHKVLSEA
jgi:hypothetical protein